uniref:Uncharacterized protein n=1 Tax=Oryza glumipatula TaxID=40148 RepID=A0A0D9YSA5_9ORYZ
MAQEGKLDLLLKTLEENERKRAEAEDRNRADLKELRAAMEAKLPHVEKQVVELHATMGDLSVKVKKLKNALLRQAKVEKMTGEVKEDPSIASPSPSPSLIHGIDLEIRGEGGGGSDPVGS